MWFSKNTYQVHQRKRQFRSLVRKSKSLLLGYKSKNNNNNFENICKTKTTSHYKTLKCNNCNKEGHIAMFDFIKKSMKLKKDIPLHTFIRNIVNTKLSSNFENAYISKIGKKNVCETNKQGPKMIWIPKLRTHFSLEEFFTVSNIKWYIDSDCS